jgi:hypothetical protein
MQTEYETASTTQTTRAVLTTFKVNYEDVDGFLTIGIILCANLVHLMLNMSEQDHQCNDVDK